MHFFQLARNPTRAIRIAFVAMLLALGLNAIAHASHWHDDTTVGTTMAQHASACGYCVTFGSLVDAPQSPAIDTVENFLVLFAAVFSSAAIVRRTATSANPRAPPRF